MAIQTYIFFDKITKLQLGTIDKDESEAIKNTDFIYVLASNSQIRDITVNNKRFSLDVDSKLVEDLTLLKNEIRLEKSEYKEACKYIKYIDGEQTTIIDATSLSVVLADKINAAYAAKENCFRFKFVYTDPISNEPLLSVESEYSNPNNTIDVIKVMNNLIYLIDQNLISKNRAISIDLDSKLENISSFDSLSEFKQTYKSFFVPYLEITKEDMYSQAILS